MSYGSAILGPPPGGVLTLALTPLKGLMQPTTPLKGLMPEP
jgi:hypothetical protein